jgi:hypothetical protein
VGLKGAGVSAYPDDVKHRNAVRSAASPGSRDAGGFRGVPNPITLI